MNIFNRYLKPKSYLGWTFPVLIAATHLFVDISVATNDPRVVQSRIPLLIAFTVVMSLGVVLPALLMLVKTLSRAWEICGPTRTMIIGIVAFVIGLLLSLGDTHGDTMGLTFISFSLIALTVSLGLVMFAKGEHQIFPQETS